MSCNDVVPSTVKLMLACQYEHSDPFVQVKTRRTRVMGGCLSDTHAVKRQTVTLPQQVTKVRNHESPRDLAHYRRYPDWDENT